MKKLFLICALPLLITSVFAQPLVDAFWARKFPAAPGRVSRNLLDRFNDTINVLDFGAIGDGVTNETAAIQRAYTNAVSRGGGRIYFPRGANGIYLFNNLIITNDNISLVSDGFVQNSLVGHQTQIRLQPYNPTNTFIRVGDDTGYTVGFKMENITLYGGDTAPFGNTGLSLSGGTYDAHLRNVAFMYFRTNLCISGGTNYPASLLHINNFSMINSTDANARGVQILWPGTGYTTAIYFSDGHISGPTNSGSYAIEQDGTVVSWNGCYMDGSHLKGVLMNRTGASSYYPVMVGSGSSIDSGNATNVVMTLGSGLGVFATIGNWAQWLEGAIKPTGRLLTSLGSLIEGYPDGALPHDAAILRAEVGIEIAFSDYSARSAATNYHYDNKIRVHARTNDYVIDVPNGGKMEVNGPGLSVTGAEDVHGLMQVDGHPLIVTSSTNKNEGEALNLQNDGTNSIIQHASFGTNRGGIFFKVNGLLSLQMGTNGDVIVPVSLSIPGLSQVNGHPLLVTSSTTPNIGQALNLSHNGGTGIVQTASFDGSLSFLELWAGGIASLSINPTNGNVTSIGKFTGWDTINVKTGYQFNGSAPLGYTLRGDGTNFVSSPPLPGDLVGPLQIYANNAAAIAGGVATNKLYRTGADPDVLCIVH